jgi:hypothetical protein
MRTKREMKQKISSITPENMAMVNKSSNKERSTTFDAGNPHRVSFQIIDRDSRKQGILRLCISTGFVSARPAR